MRCVKRKTARSASFLKPKRNRISICGVPSCSHRNQDTPLPVLCRLSNIAQGPSAKFLVQNIHTLSELKMTGNCLRGSWPLSSFDPTFDKEPHYALLKELFIQIFSIPQYHSKNQPFVDHVFTFTVTDERIWFRNY
ncbi:ribosome biogenesis protein BRX1 homolog isoform 1-T2 [Morphnus guianensis]